MRDSATARSKRWHEAQGHLVAKAEYYNPWSRRLHDLFGVFDLIVMDESPSILGVQCTTSAHVADRVEKIRASHEATAWLARGQRIWVEGWSKRGKRGERKTWEVGVSNIVPRVPIAEPTRKEEEDDSKLSGGANAIGRVH